MFTGIVAELGELAAFEPLADSARLTFRGPLVVTDAAHGDSIACNGVCLTVVSTEGDTFTVDVMKETLDHSTLGALTPGAPVNLERSVTMATRLGGHLVQGHVDGVGTVLRREGAEHWALVDISLPAHLARYVVHKGSIAVDGVSLTVAALNPGSFTVSLVPTTLQLTTLGHRKPGEAVNLEVDVVAKYVAKSVEHLMPGGSA